MDFSNLKDPFKDINRLKGSFAAIDLVMQNQKQIQDILKPYNNLNEMIVKINQRSSDIVSIVNYFDYNKPMISYFDDSFLTPMCNFQKQFKNLNNFTSDIIDASKLGQNILSIQKWQNNFVDISKIGTSIAETFDFKKILPNLFQPVNKVISSNSLNYFKNDLNSLFPNGLIDFSKHPILSTSFLDMSNTLALISKKIGISLEEQITIEDNLNIALNAEHERSLDVDSEIPFIILDEELRNAAKYLKSIKHWSKSTFESVITHFRNQSTTYIVGFLTSVLGSIPIYYITLTLNQLHQIEDNSGRGKENTFEVSKIVKSQPNYYGLNIDRIPKNVAFTIIEYKKDWIRISFINVKGRYIEGWVTNKNINK